MRFWKSAEQNRPGDTTKNVVLKLLRNLFVANGCALFPLLWVGFGWIPDQMKVYMRGPEEDQRGYPRRVLYDEPECTGVHSRFAGAGAGAGDSGQSRGGLGMREQFRGFTEYAENVGACPQTLMAVPSLLTASIPARRARGGRLGVVVRCARGNGFDVHMGGWGRLSMALYSRLGRRY